MDEYTEITGIKPVTLSRDGERLRFIFRTSNADLHLELPRPHLESLIDALIGLSEAATLHSAQRPQSWADAPEWLQTPATLRIDEATIVARENSVLIRWGSWERSAQINIYNNAYRALLTAFGASPTHTAH